MNLPPETDDLEMFERTSDFLFEQFKKLSRKKTTPAVERARRELLARSRRLSAEMERWMETEYESCRKQF